MLILLADLALIFSFGIAPALLFFSFWRRRKISGVILSWKQTGAAILTIGAFVLNLTLFISTAIFFSGILGSRTYPEWFTFPPDKMRQLAMITGSLLFGLTLLYIAIGQWFIQLVTTEGILYTTYHSVLPIPIYKKITWGQIRDYYTRSDFPVTIYTLLLKKEEELGPSVQLRIPFYVQDEFQRIVDQRICMVSDSLWEEMDMHPDFTRDF